MAPQETLIYSELIWSFYTIITRHKRSSSLWRIFRKCGQIHSLGAYIFSFWVIYLWNLPSFFKTLSAFNKFHSFNVSVSRPFTGLISYKQISHKTWVSFEWYYTGNFSMHHFHVKENISCFNIGMSLSLRIELKNWVYT